MLRKQITIVMIGMSTMICTAQSDSSRAGDIGRYLKPYVRSNNFSGAALVSKDGKVIFEKAFGFADREKRVRNTTKTRFHIASVSMQFTAAAVLRIIDSGALKLDDRAKAFAPEVDGAERISVRDL